MRLSPALVSMMLAASPALSAGEQATHPAQIDPRCRGGQAEIYDECGSQADVLSAAQAQAKQEGKVVLVVYGAEWCIWCHVFSAYVAGGYGAFDYTIEKDAFRLYEGVNADSAGAKALADYVEQTFVIAHIEGQYSPDGDDVLSALNAWDAYANWIPYIFAIKDERFAAALPDNNSQPDLEVRREGLFWYRGYNRGTLRAELQKLEAAAR